MKNKLIDKETLYNAYPGHASVHPRVGGGQRPLDPVSAGKKLEELLGQIPVNGAPRTAYFHIPYCDSRCTFCPFYKEATRESDFAPYIEALIRQLRSWKYYPAIFCRPLESVYMGGGTPSAIPTNLLVVLLGAIRENLPLSDKAEWTLEGRPFNIEEEKYRSALEMGVSRVSFGVQSFDTKVRRGVGRRLSGGEVEKRLRRVASWGFEQVAADLIYGLPGQTMDIWRDDVKRAINLRLAGIAVYRLKLFPASILKKQVEDGNAQVADNHLMIDMFLAAREMLFNADYEQIEPVHYGLPGKESYRYGSTVWMDGDCFPYGGGAGGNVGPLQLFLDREPAGYTEKMAKDKSPVQFGLLLNNDALFQRQVQFDLMHGGLDLAFLGEKYRIENVERYAERIETLRERALVEMTDGLVRLTDTGVVWANEVCEELTATPDNAHSPEAVMLKS